MTETPTPNGDQARERLAAGRTEVAKAVVGQDAAVSGLLVALLCGGHVLMEGVPTHLSYPEIGQALAAVDHVLNVHDLHIWHMSAERTALSADVMIERASLPEPRRGDILAVAATGAYTLGMSSNYNAVPRPAAVLVAKGGSRVIRLRETVDDLIRLEAE